MFDLARDPLQMANLADDPCHAELRADMEAKLAALQAKRGDELVPCTAWKRDIVKSCG
jgi:hypothetical protein